MFAQLSGIGRTALVTTCDVHAHRGELRQQHLELAKSHERLAADDRQMQRPMPAHDVEHAVDELLPLVVGQLPQHDVAAEMRVAVGVAARTTQRTFARDFDGEIRPVPLKNEAPGLDDGAGFHLQSLSGSPPRHKQGIARKAQILDDAAADDVLLDDALRVLRRDVAVPRAFRVHDGDRPAGADPQALARACGTPARRAR